jgi:hypothetical protein
MNGEVTELWAVTYLQILIGLLVFAFGVPGVLYEVLIPEPVRLIARRRSGSRWMPIALSTLGVASLLFIWVLHPGHEPLARIIHEETDFGGVAS